MGPCTAGRGDPRAGGAVVQTSLRVKLIIQIPCLERARAARLHLRRPAAPRAGDRPDRGAGGRRRQHATARPTWPASSGVHHIIRFPRNRGLSAAYAAGIDACLRLSRRRGGQHRRRQPVPRRRHRFAWSSPSSPAGPTWWWATGRPTPSRTSRCSSASCSAGARGWSASASGTEVADSTSGFRALSRHAASTLFVHNRFSYTLETIIQAGQAGLVLENVAIETNPRHPQVAAVSLDPRVPAPQRRGDRAGLQHVLARADVRLPRRAAAACWA